MTNLVYMAKPIYGGWVTFTAHLSLKYEYPLYKIGKRTEKNKRNYGYDVSYQNMNINDLLQKDDIMITAVDKHYNEYLHMFPKDTKLIIHDPTELKGKNNPLKELMSHFKIITIRKTVQSLLLQDYGIHSEYKPHPFYEYQKTNKSSPYHSLSISRIDFDKHTEHILEANKYLDNEKQIYIFGAENRLYVHHKLKEYPFHEFWKGKYPKTLPLEYNGQDLLNDCKFVVDMSIIKEDGGGTQYTFLEAIYHQCALILHKEWVEKGNTFIKDKNCYVVGYTDDPGKEIADIIETGVDDKYHTIVTNASSLLKTHTLTKW